MIKKALKRLVSIASPQYVDLSETQCWTLEELQEFWLWKIVRYAYSHLPGYRKKFDQTGFFSREYLGTGETRENSYRNRELLQNNI